MHQYLKHVKKSTELVAELSYEIVRERLVGIGRYVTHEAQTQHDINTNRVFATKIFAGYGKIQPQDIDEATGLLKADRFHEKGQVSYVNTEHNDKLVTVGKLIWGKDMPKDDLRTPFEDIKRLNPELFEKLDDLDDGKIGELSSLAKVPGTSQVATLGTLREIYKIATDNGVEYMVAGLEPKAWPRYKALFGSGIELVSDSPLNYPGITGDQVGICMNVSNVYEYYHRDISRGNLAIRAQRLLTSEYYSNRIDSYPSVFDKFNLRKIA